MIELTSKDKRKAYNNLKKKPVSLLFPVAARMASQGKCPVCYREIKDLEDECSLTEYHISGLCQTCQDRLL